ncbi:GNAT family N-acetyltransferase [Haploplasma axanthum]|uniref:Uncharacterized protein n=1 Tax=Haploplasma axanthum TaxID=29552 RepID=A0A449BCS7_HAPAX|nr:GNAT family N-acetyltransferase [Haploplasma axanthum]VEU80261.1 Uncharacterised protein [Haploplasma axanthum]
MKFINEGNRIYNKDENGKLLAEVTFPFIEEKVINIDHTFVDPSLRGAGIAGELMIEVYNYAKEKGYTVVNTCPYAVAWYKKHTDKHDVLNKEIELPEACRI